jgi:hypothetical protein
MPTYVAITRRLGPWEAVCSGPDPEVVFREAETIIRSEETYPEEDAVALSPDVELLLQNLSVVPDAVARTRYQVIVPRDIDEL